MRYRLELFFRPLFRLAIKRYDGLEASQGKHMVLTIGKPLNAIQPIISPKGRG